MRSRGRIPAVLLLCVLLACPAGQAAARGVVQVGVDRDAQVRPFSPLIFGVNFGDQVRNAEVGHPLLRWGGNAATRYTWQVDVHNTAQDWFFENAPGDDDSPPTAARRLRSLRELYDPARVSESWIAALGDGDANHDDKPNLIPRVRARIDAYCPGTRLAITEYNWGNDDTASGAVAQAELFGIFAREGVDVAARWVAPVAGSRVGRAVAGGS